MNSSDYTKPTSPFQYRGWTVVHHGHWKAYHAATGAFLGVNIDQNTVAEIKSLIDTYEKAVAIH